MIPQSWDDVAATVSLTVQGLRLVRKCFRERDNIRARFRQSAQTTVYLSGRLIGQVRRDWRAFNSMPLLARFALASLFLNFGTALTWYIAVGSPPMLLTVYPVLGITSLALYAAYLGAKLTGRRVKRLGWQR